jgi:hypothetical protein
MPPSPYQPLGKKGQKRAKTKVSEFLTALLHEYDTIFGQCQLTLFRIRQSGDNLMNFKGLQLGTSFG